MTDGENGKPKGKVSDAEARQITAATEVVDAAQARLKGDDEEQSKSRPARLKAAFLRGDLSETKLHVNCATAAVAMGLVFGGIMVALDVYKFDFSAPSSDGFGAPSRREVLMSGAGQGAFFGFFMYLFMLLPHARGLIRLRRGIGAPLETLAAARKGQCPTCGAENAKVWGSRSFVVMHWKLNPGLLVNELLFGQRIPADMHHCRECSTYFVECVTCERSVDAALWRAGNVIGRWKGLSCPRCEGPIESERNVWALAIEKVLVVLMMPLRALGMR